MKTGDYNYFYYLLHFYDDFYYSHTIIVPVENSITSF